MRLRDYSINHNPVTYAKRPAFLITVLNANVFFNDKKFMDDKSYDLLCKQTANHLVTVCYQNHFTPNGLRRRIFNVYVDLPEELTDSAMTADGVVAHQHVITLRDNIDPYYESDYSDYLNERLRYLKSIKAKSKTIIKPKYFSTETLAKLSVDPDLQLRCYEYNHALCAKAESDEILLNAYESLKAAVDETLY